MLNLFGSSLQSEVLPVAWLTKVVQDACHNPLTENHVKGKGHREGHRMFSLTCLRSSPVRSPHYATERRLEVEKWSTKVSRQKNVAVRLQGGRFYLPGKFSMIAYAFAPKCRYMQL